MKSWRCGQLSIANRFLRYDTTEEFNVDSKASLSTPPGPIQRVTTFKLLGLHLDASLSWTTNINIQSQQKIILPGTTEESRRPTTPTTPFLADRTNGRAIATLLRLPSPSSSSVTLCIVAKRCVLEQKLLWRAYRKSYMRNRLVPKWMTLTFV